MTPTPRQGDQILQPPTEQTVKDPVVDETKTEDEPGVLGAGVGDGPLPPLELPALPPDYPHILLEGLLTPVECDPRDHKQYRVTGVRNGITYEHTSNLPDGTWLYREVK